MKSELGLADEIEVIAPGRFLRPAILDELTAPESPRAGREPTEREERLLACVRGDADECPGPLLAYVFADPDEFVECFRDPQDCDAPVAVTKFLDRGRIAAGTAVRECEGDCCSFYPSRDNKYNLSLLEVCFGHDEDEGVPYVRRLVMDADPV